MAGQTVRCDTQFGQNGFQSTIYVAHVYARISVSFAFLSRPSSIEDAILFTKKYFAYKLVLAIIFPRPFYSLFSLFVRFHVTLDSVDGLLFSIVVIALHNKNSLIKRFSPKHFVYRREKKTTDKTMSNESKHWRVYNTLFFSRWAHFCTRFYASYIWSSIHLWTLDTWNWQIVTSYSMTLRILYTLCWPTHHLIIILLCFF